MERLSLGDKLPNPYSMENMRKAIAELQSRGLSKVTLSTDIKPTHYYIRFKPKNEAEVDAVEADTTVFYYSWPLDREIVGDSTNYRNPELPDSVPSYMYCTMPVDHVMPDVEHELQKCTVTTQEVITTKNIRMSFPTYYLRQHTVQKNQLHHIRL